MAMFGIKDKELDESKSARYKWRHDKYLAVSSAEKWGATLLRLTALKTEAALGTAHGKYLAAFRSKAMLNFYRAWTNTRRQAMGEIESVRLFKELSGYDFKLREIQNIREAMRQAVPIDLGDYVTKGLAIKTPHGRSVYIEAGRLIKLAFPNGVPAEWDATDAALLA
jgi:hypothetical protein